MGSRKWRFVSGVLVAILVIAVFGAVSAWAADWYVATTGSDTNGDGSQGNPWQTIGHAVGQASASDTINVAAGTYAEQLTIDKPLTLSGPNAGINPNTETRGAEAVIDVSSYTGYGIDVTAEDVTIDGFEITGIPYSGSTSSADNPAIKAEANYATVQNCVFNNATGTKGKEAMLAVPGINHISFLNNKVNNYIYGFTARGNGWGGSATLPNDGVVDLTVSGNTFNVAYVDTGSSIYGMGVQIQYGDNIVVTGNTINGPGKFESCTYDLINSIGIADFMSGYGAAGAINYSNNDITNCYVGIATFAGNGQISGNSVHANNIGIQVGQNDDVYISTPATGVAITGNDIHNNIRGIWAQNFVVDGLAAHFNNIVGNTEYGVINEDPENDVFDATNNWWGDDSGPSGEGPGTGDAVSTNVDYDPWVRSTVSESTTETVSGGGTVATPSGDASAVVTGTGDTTVTVSKYDGNPAGSGFGADEAGYVDVYLPDTTGVTEITIKLHYDPAAVTNEANLVLRWWDGINWVKCSDQGVDTANDILWAKIRSDTVPTLAQLGGTIFGGGSGQPASVLWYEDFEYADQAAMESAGWVFSTNPENLWHLATEAHVPSLAYPKLTPFPSSNHAVWFGNEATGSYNGGGTSPESVLNPQVRAQRARIHTMTGVGHPYGELTSPEIDVSGQTSVKVSFDYFREVECYPQGTYDKTYAQVSFDDGPWQTIWSHSSQDCWEAEKNIWIPASVDGVPVYKEYWIPVGVPSGATNMKIRFVFDAVDNIANDYLGWLIDDLKVSTAGPAGLHFEQGSLPEGLVNQAYSAVIHAVGGTGSYSWRVISKPDWLTVHPNGTEAELSGTPTASGTYELCIGISDDRGETYSQCYAIVVEQVISSSGVLFYDAFEGAQPEPWTTTGLWHKTQNVSCVSPPYASPTHVYYYGKDATCNYATAGANSGALTSPDISVSGITPGSKLTIGWKYWRKVENYNNGSFDKSYVEYKFDNQSNWTQIWYDDSKQNQPMGGWHLVEATTDTAGNDIVVPAGASTLKVRFTFDTVDGYANNYIGWLIDDVKVVQQVAGVQALAITTTCPLPGGTEGQAYGPVQLQATGGTGTYTWSVTGLPSELTCSPAGVISGTPSLGKAGTHSVTITVTDSAGNTASKTCDLTIAQLPPPPPCPNTVLTQDFTTGLETWNTTGLWHITSDTSCISCGELSGNYAYFGQDTSCNYATGARVLGYLTSPQFDVDPCITDLLLEFHHYRQVESYNGAYDKTYVQIKWDAGAWHTVWYKDSKDASPNCEDIVIGPIARGTHTKLQVRFVFDSVDKLYNNYTGWAIDDVTVWNKDGAGAPSPNVGPLSNLEPQAVAPRDQISVLNIPNPVRDVHTTTFTVRGVGIEAIKIQIFDLDENLVYEEEVPGNELIWHTVNEYGEYLANGVYFYRALAKIDGKWIPTKFQKLVILR